METLGVSAVIPNYNGRKVLELCLPSVQEALRHADVPHEIIVVDDGSTDDSVDFLATAFPEVRVCNTDGRQGQERALNVGFESSRHPIVMQLDSDTRVHAGFVRAALPHFADATIFAVAPAVYDWKGEWLACGRAVGGMRRGMLRVTLDESARSGETSLFASGCAALFRRDAVLEIGGYDPMYESAHMDEIDLAYRAWKAGWRIVYEPAAIAYHLGSATRDQVFTDARLERLKARNQWLFAWKNISDPGLLVRHLAWIPIRVAAAAVRGRRGDLAGFIDAARGASIAARGRQTQRRFRLRGDRSVLQLCGSPAAIDRGDSNAEEQGA